MKVRVFSSYLFLLVTNLVCTFWSQLYTPPCQPIKVIEWVVAKPVCELMMYGVRGMNMSDLEKQNITKAIIDYYSQGHVKSDPELYEHILHDRWLFYVYVGEELKIVDKTEYMSWYDPDKNDESLVWNTDFFYVDITNNIAQAKIKLENQKIFYTDYFNLVKNEGGWWIVNKLSDYTVVDQK